MRAPANGIKGFGHRTLQRTGRARKLNREVKSKRLQSADPTNLTFQAYIEIVNPDFRFYAWNEIAIARLQEVADGKLLRLLIQVPPRHGKSELAKLFAGYYLLRHPRRYVGVCGYGADLTYPFSRTSRYYFKLAGGILNPEAQAVTLWETRDRGGCWAASVGGSVTGKGAHLAILDDPLKDREEAESKAVIRTLHSWYKSSFRTRINPEDGAIVIIQTRWSEVDAIGLALDLEENAPEEYREGWHLIDFPATYEPWELRPRIPECVTVEEDFRTVVGTPLCPERYDARALGIIRATLGSREWNCLYQQNPVALEAAIFRASWWKYRTQVAADGSRLPRARVIISVDCAFEDAGTSDFVCVAILGQRVDGTFDVIDVINERLDVVKTMAVIKEQVKKWSPSAVLIEKAANGHAVIQMMRKKIPNIVPIKPSEGGSKVTRAQGAAPMIEAGSVFLPLDAHWLPFVIDQFSTFPVGKNDDAVDAITQALNWLRDRANPILSIATWGRSANTAHRRSVTYSGVTIR